MSELRTADGVLITPGMKVYMLVGHQVYAEHVAEEPSGVILLNRYGRILLRPWNNGLDLFHREMGVTPGRLYKSLRTLCLVHAARLEKRAAALRGLADRVRAQAVARRMAAAKAGES